MWFTSKQKPTNNAVIPADIGGLRVRPSAKARRMGLRVDARTGDVVFTWPLKSRITPEKALRFIEENRGWIAKQHSVRPQAKPFAPGTVLHVAGVPCVIRHETGRGLTRIEGSDLIVHGRAEHLPRRVKDFLKKVAAEKLTALTHEKSRVLGLKPASVRILDPRSRWGSCAPDGRIMYSWRLLLAPYEVMDYVVAHEVSHRVHLNHSKKFWRQCLALAPHSGRARRWLRQQGRTLLSYGSV